MILNMRRVGSTCSIGQQRGPSKDNRFFQATEVVGMRRHRIDDQMSRLELFSHERRRKTCMRALLPANRESPSSFKLHASCIMVRSAVIWPRPASPVTGTRDGVPGNRRGLVHRQLSLFSPCNTVATNPLRIIRRP